MISKSLADAAELKLTDVAKTLAATQAAYFSDQVGTDAEGMPRFRQKYARTAPTTMLVDTVSVTYECHEYEGTLGKGYILHAWVIVSGRRYHWQRDFGPEKRDQSWAEVSQ